MIAALHCTHIHPNSNTLWHAWDSPDTLPLVYYAILFPTSLQIGSDCDFKKSTQHVSWWPTQKFDVYFNLSGIKQQEQTCWCGKGCSLVMPKEQVRMINWQIKSINSLLLSHGLTICLKCNMAVFSDIWSILVSACYEAWIYMLRCEKIFYIPPSAALLHTHLTTQINACLTIHDINTN